MTRNKGVKFQNDDLKNINYSYDTKIALDQARGVTGKFFWGVKVIFPDFFPVWNAFSR